MLLTHDELAYWTHRIEAGELTAEERDTLGTLLLDVEPAPPALTFREFIAIAEPSYHYSWSLEILIARLQQVAERTLKNLMVVLPPRHGKTKTTAELFSAYWRYRFPWDIVGYGVFGQKLATDGVKRSQEYQARVRAHLTAKGLLPERRAASALDGYMWGRGALADITGRGAGLLIGDDFIKNHQEALSPVLRESRGNWVTSTFMSRAQYPFARVVIGTRWHPDDPQGRLLKQAAHPEGRKWHIVHFEAVRSGEPYLLDLGDGQQIRAEDIGCTIEEDPREEGEPLNPFLVPMSLLQEQRAAGSYWWSALYQGRPRAMKGNLFKEEWFEGKRLAAPPAASETVARVRYWDLAGTEKGEGIGATQPDFTAGCRMARTRDNRIVIEHVHRGQWSPMKRDLEIQQTMARDAAELGGKDRIVAGHEREAGIDAKKRQRTLAGILMGFVIKVLTPVADKIKRAMRPGGFQSQCEAGNVYLLETGDMQRDRWIYEFLYELGAFPFGEKDDQVDAATGAFDLVQEVENADWGEVISGGRPAGGADAIYEAELDEGTRTDDQFGGW